MAEARLDRRLAAILAADVAGYSRLMGTDALRLGHQAIYQQQLDLDQANDTTAAAGFRSFSLQEAALAIPDEEAITLIPDRARIMIGGFMGGGAA